MAGTQDRPAVRVRVPAANLIGESPVWSVREQALYWVDVEGRRVFRLEPRGSAVSGSAVTAWDVPEAIGCIGLRRGGGLIAALRTGIAFLDTVNGNLEPVADPEADVPGNRFNDGPGVRGLPEPEFAG